MKTLYRSIELARGIHGEPRSSWIRVIYGQKRLFISKKIRVQREHTCPTCEREFKGISDYPWSI